MHSLPKIISQENSSNVAEKKFQTRRRGHLWRQCMLEEEITKKSRIYRTSEPQKKCSCADLSRYRPIQAAAHGLHDFEYEKTCNSAYHFVGLGLGILKGLSDLKSWSLSWTKSNGIGNVICCLDPCKKVVSKRVKKELICEWIESSRWSVSELSRVV